MRNLSCGNQEIFLNVTSLRVKRVETEGISY